MKCAKKTFKLYIRTLSVAWCKKTCGPWFESRAPDPGAQVCQAASLGRGEASTMVQCFLVLGDFPTCFFSCVACVPFFYCSLSFFPSCWDHNYFPLLLLKPWNPSEFLRCENQSLNLNKKVLSVRNSMLATHKYWYKWGVTLSVAGDLFPPFSSLLFLGP